MLELDWVREVILKPWDNIGERWNSPMMSKERLPARLFLSLLIGPHYCEEAAPMESRRSPCRQEHGQGPS